MPVVAAVTTNLEVEGATSLPLHATPIIVLPRTSTLVAERPVQQQTHVTASSTINTTTKSTTAAPLAATKAWLSGVAIGSFSAVKAFAAPPEL